MKSVLGKVLDISGYAGIIGFGILLSFYGLNEFKHHILKD